MAAKNTYGDVKATAANQDIYDVAVIIAGLQQPTLEEVVTLQATLLISSRIDSISVNAFVENK